MEKFFSPESIAVIGASNGTFNLGATICQSLKEYLKYNGRVYAVNRKGEDVKGCQGFSSVMDLPEAADLAIIITPAQVVPQFMKECGEKGIQRVVIESAGFSEEGDSGTKLQEQMNEIARAYNMRFLGPNCLGTLDTKSHFCSFYGVNHIMIDMINELNSRDGTISYIIQSGGVGVLVLESCVTDVISVNKMVSIGNKSDIDESDLIEYFSHDGTQVICMYLENIKDGRKLMDAARNAGKPVIAFKVGRTEAGSKAAMSHTAGMANNDAVFDKACRQSGIIRARSITELHSLPKIFTTMPPLRGKNIALFTNSGAFGGITADLLTEAGLSLIQLAPETREKLKKTGQTFNVKNPVDIGPALPKTYLDIFEILLSAKEVDAILPLASIWQTFVIDVLLELQKMCQHYQKPAAIYCPNATGKILAVRKEHQLALFESPEEAVRALAVSYQYTDFINRRSPVYEENIAECNSEQPESTLRI